MNIEQTVERQRAFFNSGATRGIQFRLAALRRLEREIRRRETDIHAALQVDLGKAPFESYMTETGLVLAELAFVQKRLRLWMAPKPAITPLMHFPSVSFVQSEPYGVALVMAPWNYPFQLAMEPLIGAIAAGNCAVLKPSAYAPATSAIMRDVLAACFPRRFVAVVEGGRAENKTLLERRFDYIFFTGGLVVGKLVMEKAAQNVTPVTLELGGKSPCIVDETADIELAGRRIAFGKFLNAGQTCIAPDYVLVHSGVKDALLASIRAATAAFFGPEPLNSPPLPKIINEKHFKRLCGLMKGETVAMGGETDGVSRIAPTVLDDVKPESPIMQEEIFGPLLPVLTFKELDEAIAFVNGREKPLALYLFTKNKAAEKKVLAACSFGGGCINDTIVHLATSHMGFGGVGQSGMGSYHGKKSYDTFSHHKSILKKGSLDLPVRYHPYTPAKEKLLRLILR